MMLFLSTRDPRNMEAMLAGDDDIELYRYLAELFQVSEINLLPRVRSNSGKDYIEISGAVFVAAFQDSRIQPMIQRDWMRRFLN